MPDISKDINNKKPRLGRGLGSLLGGGVVASQASVPAPSQESSVEVKLEKPSSSQTPVEARIWNIAIDKLIPSQFQPRQIFNKEKIEELALSIKQHGIIQPILARRLSSGAFEIIAGERRWRAAQIAGLHEIPVLLKTQSHQESLELGIIENLQREDLSPIEEAEAYQRLMSEFHLTQQQVAEKVGKDRVTIANALRLLNLPLDARDYLAKGEISSGQAKVLLSLKSEAEISKMAKLAVTKKMTVRDLEKAIAASEKKHTDNHQAPGAEASKKNLIRGLSEELQRAFGTKIDIEYKSGKGKLVIHFYSDSELNQLIDKMRQACQKN